MTESAMTEHLYLLTLFMPLATILIVFGMRYASSVYQARARAANDNAYRTLAEKAVAAQRETAASLSSVQAALSEIGNRLIAVEIILKAVE
jgi:uncharacterized membrane protein